MNIIKHIVIFLKGVAMGTANVIPGVSGGTIALISGIFERIIDAIKHTFSIQSVKLIFTGRWKEWFRFTDVGFMLTLGLGILTAIISFARLLEYLFANYPVYVWAFFFGLVLASVWYVSITVKKWTPIVITFFIIGTGIATALALLSPANENTDNIYLLICGAVAACSMILPGISGSFVLVLMGNYELVMIHAVNEANINVLVPVIIGAGIGLLGFSYILSWIFKKFRNQTIAILAGFMLGSLIIIWPWKETIWKISANGSLILDRNGNRIVEKYAWTIPSKINTEVFLTALFILIGIAVIVFTETLARKSTNKKTE